MARAAVSNSRIERAYDPPDKDDGVGLGDRLWPRGLSKESAAATLRVLCRSRFRNGLPRHRMQVGELRVFEIGPRRRSEGRAMVGLWCATLDKIANFYTIEVTI